MVVMKIAVFWDETLCSSTHFYHTFGGTCCLEYQHVLKTEIAHLFEILVDIYHTKWHHVPEDRDLHRERVLS
jgi:hypothetical protein